MGTLDHKNFGALHPQFLRARTAAAQNAVRDTYSKLRTWVYTQQWARPVTAGVHGVSNKKCRLEVVE